MSNAMTKLFSVAGGIFVAVLTGCAALADGPDISTQRLLESWRGDDSGLAMVAEVTSYMLQ